MSHAQHSKYPYVGESTTGWKKDVGLAVGALGIVFGDIGTSPLYALRECFHNSHGIPFNENAVLGILSLIVWSLIITISIKYLMFVMRADNRGEGGALALLALVFPQSKHGGKKRNYYLLGIGLFSAALLYGDGAITPAISVLSAVEGLTVVTPGFSRFIVPVTLILLVILFCVQHKGTEKIGKVFGPCMLVWFFCLAVLGVVGIYQNPIVLKALNPQYGWDFISQHVKTSFSVLGAVFLAVTGGEALYADMGHFGKEPIRNAWFVAVLPALLLNYFGQGALVLANPEAIENPFYHLVPKTLLYPMVLLSTVATFIASQALISGVFSLTKQAMQLGFCPRLRVVHTSSEEIGQIYLPQVNWTLCAATIWLVITFHSSTNLAAAYGIAVATTMVTTTLMTCVVAKRIWGWNIFLVGLILLFFISFDLVFFFANIMKIADGGWFPISAGLFVFLLMSTWNRGRRILGHRLRSKLLPFEEFVEKIASENVQRISGTAVFMAGDPHSTPPALLRNLKHNKIIHERIILLTIQTQEVPHIPQTKRIRVEKLYTNIYRLLATYGFMDNPNIPEILKQAQSSDLHVDLDDVTFFLGRETLLASDKRGGMALWREHLFSIMSRNAQPATTYFQIPPEQVIEIGTQVEL